uniref:Uncharacterized protein n=1 Tax=Arundo donax TaxID=35708 RepID=A0A0A9FL57_ARUDO
MFAYHSVIFDKQFEVCLHGSRQCRNHVLFLTPQVSSAPSEASPWRCLFPGALFQFRSGGILVSYKHSLDRRQLHRVKPAAGPPHPLPRRQPLLRPETNLQTVHRLQPWWRRLLLS